MFPIFSSDDAANHGGGDFVAMRKGRLGVPAGGVFGSKFADLLFCKFSSSVCTALIFVLLGLYGHSSFCVAVGHVVSASSKEQVVRSNAGTVVASVQDAEVSGDFAEVEFIRKAVHGNLSMVFDSHSSIAGMVHVAYPIPAILCFLDVRPKPSDRIRHGEKYI